MKTNLFISFLFFSTCLLFYKKSEAQEIRNDTIILSTGDKVTITFPDEPNFEFVDGGDGSYEIEKLGKKSFLLKAVSKGVKPQRIKIIEDERTHEFILIQKDVAPKLKFEWAKRRDLKNYVDKKDKNADKRLEAANQLYEQGNLAAALTEYKWLVWEVNKSKEGFVANRITETETQLREAMEKKYKDVMARGDKHASEKKYKEAVMAYDDALAAKPDDAVAKEKRSSTNNLLFMSYKKKAEDAVASKNYIEAELNYAEAKKVDSILFAPNEKSYRNVVENAKKQREKNEKEKKYYTILADAKLLAAKAVTAQDYDMAIKEYKKASEVFPSRKFPEDKKQFLTKMKKSLSAKK